MDGAQKAVDGWLKGLTKGRQRKPPAVVDISAGTDATKTGDNGSSSGKSDKADPKEGGSREEATAHRPPPPPKPAKPTDPGYLPWSKIWHMAPRSKLENAMRFYKVRDLSGTKPEMSQRLCGNLDITDPSLEEEEEETQEEEQEEEEQEKEEQGEQQQEEVEQEEEARIQTWVIC